MGDGPGPAGLEKAPQPSPGPTPQQQPGTSTGSGAAKRSSGFLPSVAQLMFGNAVVARAVSALGPAPADWFRQEFENQFIPPEIQGRVEVAAPSLKPGKTTSVTLLFGVPVEPIQTITLYAVPESELFETAAAAALPRGKDRDQQSLLVAGAPRIPDLTPRPPAGAAAAKTGVAPAAAGTAPSATGTRMYTATGPIEVIAR